MRDATNKQWAESVLRARVPPLPRTPPPATPSEQSRRSDSALSPARLVVFFAVLFATLFAVTAATTAIIRHTSVPSGAYFALFTPIALSDVDRSVPRSRSLARAAAPDGTRRVRSRARDLHRSPHRRRAIFDDNRIIALLGGYSVGGTESVTVLAAPVLMALGSAVTEELLVRGVVFRLLEESVGSWAALLISAALFGSLTSEIHTLPCGAATAIAIEAGMMLAAAYMVTRRLWLPIGIHAAWNYTQGGVFGVAVSGAAMKGFLRGTLRGPAWLSGGPFGTEASAVAVVVCGAVSVLFLAKAVRSGNLISALVDAAPARRIASGTYDARLPDIH